MSDNLSFLLTCAAECLNNWGYDGHGKHVDDGVKEITRLRAENEKLRDAYDTDALTISYNLGYTCGKDIAKDEIERLRGLLREAHVKMVENDLWVNLRQRVAAAIRESEAKP